MNTSNVIRCICRRAQAKCALIVWVISIGVPASTACAQVGACCLCTGQCLDNTSNTQCQSQNGVFFPGLTCLQVNCEPFGACCIPGQGCVDNIRQSQCPPGADFYPCAPCSQQPCAPRACCFCNGACQNLTSPNCLTAGGQPQGPGTNCGVVQCIPYGACCYLNGPAGPICVDNVSAVNCPPPNAIFYPCQNCANVPCGLQACCFCNGTCQDLSVTDCTSAAFNGTPQGPGTTCATVVCPKIGACCVNQTCVDNWTQAQCAAAGGTFFVCQFCVNITCPGVGACCFSCQPPAIVPPCPSPHGAGPPCIGGVSKAYCEQILHGVYRGDGSACLSPTGAPTCRCIGDVNGDGATNVLDFNILAANFGGGIPNCLLHVQGDLNCDGIVNVLDFNILAGNYGCH